MTRIQEAALRKRSDNRNSWTADRRHLFVDFLNARFDFLADPENGLLIDGVRLADLERVCLQAASGEYWLVMEHAANREHEAREFMMQSLASWHAARVCFSDWPQFKTGSMAKRWLRAGRNDGSGLGAHADELRSAHLTVDALRLVAADIARQNRTPAQKRKSSAERFRSVNARGPLHGFHDNMNTLLEDAAGLIPRRYSGRWHELPGERQGRVSQSQHPVVHLDQRGTYMDPELPFLGHARRAGGSHVDPVFGGVAGLPLKLEPEFDLGNESDEYLIIRQVAKAAAGSFVACIYLDKHREHIRQCEYGHGRVRSGGNNSTACPRFFVAIGNTKHCPAHRRASAKMRRVYARDQYSDRKQSWDDSLTKPPVLLKFPSDVQRHAHRKALAKWRNRILATRFGLIKRWFRDEARTIWAALKATKFRERHGVLVSHSNCSYRQLLSIVAATRRRFTP